MDRGWSQPEKCLRWETTNRVIFHFHMPNLGTVSMLQLTECNACREAAVSDKDPSRTVHRGSARGTSPRRSHMHVLWHSGGRQW